MIVSWPEGNLWYVDLIRKSCTFHAAGKAHRAAKDGVVRQFLSHHSGDHLSGMYSNGHLFNNFHNSILQYSTINKALARVRQYVLSCNILQYGFPYPSLKFCQSMTPEKVSKNNLGIDAFDGDYQQLSTTFLHVCILPRYDLCERR